MIILAVATVASVAAAKKNDRSKRGPPAAAAAAADPGADDDEPCADLDEDCGAWALLGECATNPDFMLPTCFLSCGVCDRFVPNGRRRKSLELQQRGEAIMLMDEPKALGLFRKAVKLAPHLFALLQIGRIQLNSQVRGA